ncbi:MAG: hydrogenase maturation protease [Fibrobacteria bacterium]|nr:hydrogenase maturation protease [Fibrobacteria bacterium]
MISPPAAPPREPPTDTDRNVVIALGNPLLCDDSAALVALRLLRERTACSRTDFVENYSSGMDLLPDLSGHRHALVMDAVRTGEHPPGSLLDFSLEELDRTRQARLVDSHGMNLATVVAMGIRFGLPMPESLTILGIEGRDFTTFQEHPRDDVMAGLPSLVGRVEAILRQWENEHGP